MATEGGAHSLRLAWMDALLSTPNDVGHGEVDGFARAVAFVLFRHMNRQGCARPGTRTLSRQSGASHAVVEDRLRRLEAAGWLCVVRQSGKTSRYSATIPTGVTIVPTAPLDGAVQANGPAPNEDGNRATAPPDGAHDRAAPWRGPDPTAPSQAETAPRDGAKPAEPSVVASTHTTHERPAWQRPPRQKWEPYVVPTHKPGTAVVGDVLWPTMAFRQLELEREQNKPGLPHPKSFGEAKLLRSIEARMVAEHEKRAKDVRDRGRVPFGDLERFIFELDPTLSKHGWGPSMAAAQAENERRQREHEAALAAMTPEEEQAARDEARAVRARIIASKAAGRAPRQRRTNLDGPPSPAQAQEAS